MTHEETIKRIQELVPSIMDLEFGCEVTKISNNLNNPVFTKGKFIRMDGMRMFCLHKDNTVFETRYGDALTSILGKPITLGVVLRAIEAKMNMKPSNRGGELIDMWNLSKDNFNDQSEETKSFIRELLGN